VKSLVLSHLYHTPSPTPYYDIVVIPHPCAVCSLLHTTGARIRRTFDPSPGPPGAPLTAPTLSRPPRTLTTRRAPHSGSQAHHTPDPGPSTPSPLQATGSPARLHNHANPAPHLTGCAAHTRRTPHTPLTITRGVCAVPTLQNRIEKFPGGTPHPDRPYPTHKNFKIAVLNWVSKLARGRVLRDFETGLEATEDKFLFRLEGKVVEVHETLYVKRQRRVPGGSSPSRLPRPPRAPGIGLSLPQKGVV